MSELAVGTPRSTLTPAEPSKPKSFTAGIRRIVTGNNDELDGSIVNESSIPFEVRSACNEILNTRQNYKLQQTGYWGMSQACIWKTSETPSNDTNIPSEYGRFLALGCLFLVIDFSSFSFDGTSRTGDRMEGYVCSMGTNFFIQDFAPGAKVPMVCPRSTESNHCSHTLGS